MSSYDNRIAELQQREATIARDLAALSDKRQQFALAASEGDARAQKQIADVDFEAAELQRDRATISSALEAAQALARQAELDEHSKQHRTRQEEAGRAAEGVTALNAEIDSMLVQLRQAFERRATLLNYLGNSGQIDWTQINRLCSRSGATSAAQSAGLAKYLALEMTPAHIVRPLVDGNNVLLNLAKAAPRNAPVLPRQSSKAAS
jgi:hypothetical protein